METPNRLKRRLSVKVPDNNKRIIPFREENGRVRVNTAEEDALLEAAFLRKEDAFLKAIKVEDFQQVVSLIPQVADLEFSDENGNTPLILAAGLGYDQIMQLLIDSGASLVAINKDGYTALDMAVANGQNYDDYLWRSEDGSDDHPAAVDVLMKALKNNKEAWDEYENDDVFGEGVVTAADRGNDEALKILLKHLNDHRQDIKEESEKLAFERKYLNYCDGYGDTPLSIE